MLLATFSFGDALITILELALLVLWIWIAIGVVFDVFRSHDLSNWAKALWLLLIFIFPLVGVLAYLIVRGHTMHEHQLRDRARYEAFSTSYPSRSPSPTTVDDLTRLGELRERGVLTEEEFERAKARVLGD